MKVIPSEIEVETKPLHVSKEDFVIETDGSKLSLSLNYGSITTTSYIYEI